MASPPQAGSPATARKPQHHPKHKRDRVNRQGKPGTLARQTPQRAPEPQRARAPSARRDENLVGSLPAMFWQAEPPARRDENRAPER